MVSRIIRESVVMSSTYDAIVVGAGRGMGKGIALKLAEEGADVAPLPM